MSYLSESDIRGSVRRFFAGRSRDGKLEDSDNIFESGYLNSLLAMQLVMFLEKEFSITIENEDLEPKNFQSINLICEFVMEKKERDSRTDS